MNTLLDLARPEIRALKPYSSARQEVTQKAIFLNANENPYGNKNNIGYNRYPLQQPQQLVACLSDIYQCRSENILITRGSDEAIDLLI